VRIEAVTVCVDYADFLAETAAQNRGLLDRWIIVTSRTDEATVDLCHRLNLECIRTDNFFRDGAEFNKGRAVDRGLAMLGHDDWLLHLDADIALPTDFRESLLDADLDSECLYGADRHMLMGWDEWQKWKQAGSTRAYHCYQKTAQWPVGARWTDIRYGYVPIGYFQLWNESADTRKGVRLRRYPEWHSNAARADVKFALQWDRRRRQILPEVIVAHLESRPGPMGANWNGRKSPKFAANAPQTQSSQQSAVSHQELLNADKLIADSSRAGPPYPWPGLFSDPWY
jgi:hypothetical protein